MRLTHLRDFGNPILFRLLLMWDRITFSRLTTAYFTFSVIHCIIQIALQSKAFTINAAAASFLSSILVQGNISARQFPVIDSNGELRLCDHIPSSFNVDSCPVVWNGTARSDNWLAPPSNSSTVSPAYAAATDSFELSVPDPVSSSSSYTVSSPVATSSAPSIQVDQSTASSTATSASSTTTSITPRRTVTVTVSPSVTSSPTPSSPAATVISGDLSKVESEDLRYYLVEDRDFSSNGPAGEKRKRSTTDGIQVQPFENNNEQVELNLTGFLWNNMPAVLDNECLMVLTSPVGILRNTKREDIVFIAFQLWVLGMSTVALLNESIPHMLASLLTHLLATAWAGFQIKHTSDFRTQFMQLTTNGACKPLNMLPNYWKERGHAEIPILALNALALLISAFLTWRLVKLFGWQTFKRVGASLTINRVYKIVLTLSITIQLSLFFMVVAVALWIDQLFNGNIARLAEFTTGYKVTVNVTLVLLVPWLMTGWFAVRRELRIPMMIFLILSMAYLVGWAFMFVSAAFRWTFVQWRFFSLMAIASVVLTLTAFILGLFCRVNFGKGLSQHLNAQQPIPGDDFSRAYHGAAADPEKVDFPSRERPIPTFSVSFGSGPDVPPPCRMWFAPRLGPRFYDSAAPPFEFQGGNQPISNPAPRRDVSNASHHTIGSVRNFDSTDASRSMQADGQFSEDGPLQRKTSKRWIIE